MRIALAGGVDETILSEVSAVILPFFTMAEATALRLVCREFLEAVRDYQWEDRSTVIQGSIRAWRASFPRARCASVRQWDGDGGRMRRGPVWDADFVHLAGLRELDMTGCMDVTGAALAHLRGIHTLDMSGCLQVADAHFAHLAGVKRLGIACCTQATLTDAAFAHLRGIQLLNMSECRQLSDAAFVHLRGIHTLFMWGCNQPAIGDAALAHLRGIHTLVMEGCDQATLTGATFAHLQGIQALGMRSTRADLVACARALGLPVTTRYFSNEEGLCFTHGGQGWEGQSQGTEGGGG